MADSNLKVAENVAGKWYVTEECIACDSCTDIAPDLFAYIDSGDYAYVLKQPSGEEEEGLAEEAKDSCPTDSIGDDGE